MDPRTTKRSNAWCAILRSARWSGLEGHFSQLVYLASLRDYNTGRYHHYGLESRYAAGSR